MHIPGVLVFQCGTAAMECARQSIGEVLDFMADMHTLTKLKVSVRGPVPADRTGGLTVPWTSPRLGSLGDRAAPLRSGEGHLHGTSRAPLSVCRLLSPHHGPIEVLFPFYKHRN